MTSSWRRLARSAYPDEHVEQVAYVLAILNHAFGVAVRELAESLPQFWTYAAATRCQAPCEMEWTQTPIRPLDHCRCVAYRTPSSAHLKETIFETCWCDLPFVATPALQIHAARRRSENVMSPYKRGKEFPSS
jgi:hypothetical protein